MSDRHRFLSSVSPLALLNAVQGLVHGSTGRRSESVNPELSILTVRERPRGGSRAPAGPSRTEARKSIHSDTARTGRRRVLSVRAFTADVHYPIPAGARLSVTVRTSDGGTSSLTLRVQEAAADGGSLRRGFRGELAFQRLAPVTDGGELYVAEGSLITVEYRQPDGSILIASASP